MFRPPALALLVGLSIGLAGRGAVAGEGDPASPRPLRGVPEIPGFDEAIGGSGNAPSPPPGASPGAPPAPPRRTVRLTVDPRVGRVSFTAVDDLTWAVVLMGNPRLSSDELSVRARTIVLWLDREKSPDLAAFADTAPETPETGPAGRDAGGAARTTGERAPAPGTQASVIPEALLGVYAEGGVDLVAGAQSFRAMEIYIDPRRHQALLVEPRFDAALPQTTGGPDIPLHVRARRARVLAQGFAVFDEAEVATSRANDRIALQVRTLTIEEYGEAVKDEPLFLGFKAFGSQRFSGRDIVARGERVPLFYAPEAAFGGEKGIREFPFRLRRTTLGERSSWGVYGFLGFGGKVGRDDWLDWTVDVGGYTKRGPAAAVELAWDAPPGSADEWARPSVVGRAKAFGLYDGSGQDRYDVEVPEGFRGLFEVENRWRPARPWRIDAEVNLFSDGDVNREFFEWDHLNHKDRSTYVRARWAQGGTAATLTQGFRVRDFATETIEEPEAALWSESVPLGPRREGRPAFDLSTSARAGRMRREPGDDADFEAYRAFRVDVEERLYAPVLVGNVRVSPFVGVHGTGYYDRTDGGDDLTCATAEAGVRADLQLHRDFDCYGGPWLLDGLRHVIDVDLGAVFRADDGCDQDEIPFFDEVEEEDRHTEVNLDVRSRWETRRQVGTERRNATVADVRLAVDWWPDEKGPYGREGPGQAEAWAIAEIVPRTVWAGGNALASFDGPEMQRAAVTVLYAPTDDLSIAGGLRFVRGEALSPWFDAYWKWSEKWALQVGGIARTYDGGGGAWRAGVLRFSDDHAWKFGVVVHDDQGDVSVYLDFLPSIGGEPLKPAFDPREPLDWWTP